MQIIGLGVFLVEHCIRFRLCFDSSLDHQISVCFQGHGTPEACRQRILGSSGVHVLMCDPL